MSRHFNSRNEKLAAREKYLQDKIRETERRLLAQDSYYGFPTLVSPRRHIFERQLEELKSQLLVLQMQKESWAF